MPPATMGVTAKFYRGSWWVFVNHQGRRRSKKVGDRATAIEVARQIRQRLTAGDLGILATEPSPAFGPYANAWLDGGVRKASTQRFYSFNLTLHILPVLGSKPVAH